MRPQDAAKHMLAPELVPLALIYPDLEPGEKRLLDEVVYVTLTPRDKTGSGGTPVTVKAKAVWLWKAHDGICGKFLRVRHPNDSVTDVDRVFRLNETSDEWEPIHRSALLS